jgi:hypothetical protein
VRVVFSLVFQELLQQTGLFRQWVNPHTGQIDEKLYALISEYDPNENYFSFPIHNQPQTIEEARFTQEQMMQGST